ncbi:hypothetical protein SKAU_G00275470 [Synaphobranchus kaupii]|uniref:Uncharacterized protein n=1 Tax=Synaphobranchus kaupii TaxID=118154 RepID=A0A9Q1IP01_SYNKA|nr:hypothetical protein SKAU_G00275470 [Synaphobranchus kaupii]
MWSFAGREEQTAVWVRGWAASNGAEEGQRSGLRTRYNAKAAHSPVRNSSGPAAFRRENEKSRSGGASETEGREFRGLAVAGSTLGIGLGSRTLDHYSPRPASTNDF